MAITGFTSCFDSVGDVLGCLLATKVRNALMFAGWQGFKIMLSGVEFIAVDVVDVHPFGDSGMPIGVKQSVDVKFILANSDGRIIAPHKHLLDSSNGFSGKPEDSGH